jgi:hypothetical protein
MSPFPASFMNWTPSCCTTDTMTEEMKRQVFADYLLLADCRKWGWILGIRTEVKVIMNEPSAPWEKATRPNSMAKPVQTKEST